MATQFSAPVAIFIVIAGTVHFRNVILCFTVKINEILNNIDYDQHCNNCKRNNKCYNHTGFQSVCISLL